ncbi:MAG: hypothetical protein PHQ59_03405 [Candidatus Daviesbacteria bacterium]|nr:hypothetical protein [Candidatus Daviesbacteria bacterium]
MSTENSIKSEEYSLMPDGLLPQKTTRASTLLIPTGLSILISVGILGMSQMENVSATGQQDVVNLTSESTICAQVITKVRSRINGEIWMSPDTCFERDIWEYITPGAEDGELFYNYIPSVTKPRDTFRVGPQPYSYP